MSNQNGFSYTKKNVEIRDDLRRHIAFLERSCEQYDRGYVDEALRIASSAYIILHDNLVSQRPIISLLTQLELKKTIKLLSTCDIDYHQDRGENHWFNPVSLASVYPIGVYKSEDQISYRPNRIGSSTSLDQFIAFSEWYEQPIFESVSGKLLSRKDFILKISNEDGGRHTDKLIRDPGYFELSRGRFGCGYKKVAEGFEVMMPLSFPGRPNELPVDMKPVPNAHFATMRQIGLELEASLIVAGLKRPWPWPSTARKSDFNADHLLRRLHE